MLINGVNLFVAEYGSRDAPPLLFIHVPTGRVVTFDRSGHFPHFEEAERYAAVVREFVSDVAQ